MKRVSRRFDAFRQQTGGNIVAELLQDMLNWLAGYLGVSIALLFVAHRLLGGAKRKADTTGSAGSRTSQATVRCGAFPEAALAGKPPVAPARSGAS